LFVQRLARFAFAIFLAISIALAAVMAVTSSPRPLVGETGLLITAAAALGTFVFSARGDKNLRLTKVARNVATVLAESSSSFFTYAFLVLLVVYFVPLWLKPYMEYWVQSLLILAAIQLAIALTVPIVFKP
jgi:hypothetical protein